MSTFNGFIEEIPGISIDRFEDANLSSSAFFLSHCHSDHMMGLAGNVDKIKEKGTHVYASSVSTAILNSKYPQLSVRVLDFMHPTNVTLSANNYISVQIIPAGHCPGSVMFLLEKDNKKILYTGDYRINPVEFPKFKQFFDVASNVIRIDHLYIDTTFFKKQFLKFPSREECVEDMFKCIQDWFDKSEENVIELLPTGYYGAEFLYIEIYKRFKMPIHVSERMFNEYRYFPEMDKVCTTDSNTKIHSHCNGWQSICKFGRVRKIKPSAWYWDSTREQKRQDFSKNEIMYRFCYSSHPSYEETVEFIKFLKPKKISFNVSNPDDFEEMRKEADELIVSFKKSPKKKVVELFSIKQTIPKKKCSLAEIDALLGGPPKKVVKNL